MIRLCQTTKHTKALHYVLINNQRKTFANFVQKKIKTVVFSFQKIEIYLKTFISKKHLFCKSFKRSLCKNQNQKFACIA